MKPRSSRAAEKTVKVGVNIVGCRRNVDTSNPFTTEVLKTTEEAFKDFPVTRVESFAFLEALLVGKLERIRGDRV